jgi:two-component system response regulator RegA
MNAFAQPTAAGSVEADELPSLMLVDDDNALRDVLGRALARRGFSVTTAASAEQAVALARSATPEYAVVDLKMPGTSGLELIRELIVLDAQTRIVVLTGYASVATAVEAIKLGAIHYLAKPAHADEIVLALGRDEGDASVPLIDTPLSVNRLEWEHIQKVLAEHDGNISSTARALNMHRRTLQRKLSKHPPG